MYPNQQPTHGSGYPGMPQPGIFPHQSGMPQPQYAMPQPQLGMPQQPSYQAPSMQQQGGYPQHGYPQQPSYPSQPNYCQQQQPSYQQANFVTGQPQIQQQFVPVYAAVLPSQLNYGSAIRRGRPTLTAAPVFNASNDAAALRKAMKGFGTNENAIIEVLCRRTASQRVEIVKAFQTSFGRDLIADIKSETSGNFERLLVCMLSTFAELYARELYDAMKGLGTNESVLVEILCTLPNREVRDVCFAFNRMYGKSLESFVQDDTSGNFMRLMVALLNGNRDESMITDVNDARVNAQELKRAGVDKIGTDESAFIRILCSKNFEQIKLIAHEYKKITGNSLENDIKSEFSGHIEAGLLAIVEVAQNRPAFFAKRLHKSMVGFGTNDKDLIRLVITRSEIDMMDIKEEFARQYGETLKTFVKGDTSGDYKNAILALIAESR